MSVALQSVSQKRARPTNFTNSTSRRLPPLPRITGEIILQVFTHRSLERSHGGTLDDNSDNGRLAVLGKTVLDAVTTHILCNRRPPLTMLEIHARKEEALSNENFEEWVTLYGIRAKVRCHPEVFSSLSTPGETRTLFYSYVGGVYAELGMEVVEKWVVDLIGHHGSKSMLAPGPSAGPQFRPSPAKKIKSEPMSPPKSGAEPIFYGSQPPPSPQRLPPPHIKGPLYLSNPLAPAQPNLPFLPLFNQTATQRRCTVEYPSEFSGPSHAGKWTVQCVVNGIPKGEGTGTSKQVAKEEAARKAYYAMGWT
ncbi:hypothetical protein AX17_000678 [Amanita inopinata Kibby_2008]|nr:hypothetical protein AX17_000678 [Amanita inopinata Kibby_2008]